MAQTAVFPGNTYPICYQSPLTDPECSCITYFQSLKFVPIIQLLALLHWLPVAAHIKLKTLMLGYKTKNGADATSLKALIKPCIVLSIFISILGFLKIFNSIAIPF